MALDSGSGSLADGTASAAARLPSDGYAAIWEGVRRRPRDLRIAFHHGNLRRPHPGVNIEGDERLELRNDLFGC